jgi:GNAT superfamily N-acetyltransferase
MDMTIARETIRALRSDDVDEAVELLLAGDFGDRRAFLAWALDQPRISPIVAEHDGRIVGTGCGAVHRDTGWVGVIYVAPERRGTGLGARITRTVLDGLEARGCRTQLLIASPMGQPIYEREGFTPLGQHIRFTIDGLPPDGPADPRIRPFAPSDFAAIAALDRTATGEDRRTVLSALVTPETTLVATDPGGGVQAFLARTPWRGGALIARDPADAVRLLERRRRSTGVDHRAGAGVLAFNTAGRAALRAAGWEEEPGHLRMIRGEPLDWQPEMIFGQFYGAIG